MKIDKRNDSLGYKDEHKHEKIVSRKHFIHNIEKINPLTLKYKKYWRDIKRRCIEGYWFEGKWMPGPLYFYINCCKILLNKEGRQGKSVGRPFLRDIEWEKAYVYMEAKGFSGFSDDFTNTCYRPFKDLDKLDEEDRNLVLSSAPENAFHNEVPKKYVEARFYLRLIHTHNLGKPLFNNSAKNVIDIEARRLGKSYWAGNGMVLHNFLTDGAIDYDDYLTSITNGEPMSSETLVGAIDTKYTKDLLSKTSLGLDYLAGQQEIYGEKYNSPLYKKYMGSLAPGKNIEAKYEYKEGTTWVTKGSRSKIHNRSFGDNPLAGNGTGPNLVCFEEVGFFGNLIESLGAMKDALRDGTHKFGVIYMFGCVCAGTKVWNHKGEKVNIEDLHQNEGIIGYEGRGVTKEPIIWMKPPAKKNCYRITVEGGEYIECSEDHPLLWSKNKWGNKNVTFKRADEIIIGDQLMQVNQIPIFGNNNAMEPRLLGLLIGDGYYGGRSVSLSIEGEDIYNWLKNKNYDLTIHKEWITKNKSIYREVTIKKVQSVLKEMGIMGQTKKLKHLPLNIHDYTKNDIAELIGGYFDADGNVKTGKKQAIVLTSKYKHLLEEVNVELLKFGASGNIVKEYRKKGYKPGVIYRLYINRSKSISQFQKHIYFIDKRKQEKLMSLKTDVKRKFYDNCTFVKSESTNKGQYYLNHNGLKDLVSKTIINVECIGEKEVYNLNAGTTHTYITNKFISGNTGGDMAGGSSEAARSVFFDPSSHDCLCFEDVWEDAGDIGFFVPYHYRLDKFRDKEGVLDYKTADKWIEKEREKLKKSKTKKPLENEKQNNPIVPSEAFLITGSSVFPTSELQDHLKYLQSKVLTDDILAGQIGELYWSTNEGGGKKLQWKPDLHGKLAACDYPVKKGADNTGAIQIWEHPELINNEVPFGLYYAGTDPYDQDDAETSESLGSTFIYKSFYSPDKTYETIVAEYTARPNKAKEHHENVRKLLTYYNARDLYENERNSMKFHFEQKNSLNLLSRTPDILKATEGTTVNRQYGLHMTSAIKSELELMTRDWLLEEAGEDRLNLHKIYSIPLLKELIYYNDKGNFDRVISFMLTICNRNSNFRIKAEDSSEDKGFKNDPFFKRCDNGLFF